MKLSFLIIAALVTGRLGGMFITMPVLGQRVFPMQVRIILLIALTMVILPTLPEYPEKHTMMLSTLLVGLALEMLLGILIGFYVSTVYHGIVVGMEIMSTQVGKGAAKQFNPSMSVSQSPIGSIALFMTLLIFLGNNCHLEMLMLLVKSFFIIPPGTVGGIVPAGMFWVADTSNMFEWGFKMASPILIFVFLNNSFLAVLSKLAPNMNVFFSIGFMVSIMGGVVIFYLLIPHIADMSQDLADQYINQLPDLIELAK
ncbi:MAG: hypothetical protein CMK59_13580 [Proteobacteria bacterium]|nr:hypothetical protein [Pseudomonadota bacterium]